MALGTSVKYEAAFVTQKLEPPDHSVIFIETYARLDPWDEISTYVIYKNSVSFKNTVLLKRIGLKNI